MSKKYAGQVILRLGTEWDYNKPVWARTEGEWTIPGWPHRDAWDAILAGDRQGVTKVRQWYPPENKDIWDGIVGLEPYSQAGFVKGNDKIIVQAKPSQLSLRQASLYNKNRNIGGLNENQIYVFGSDGTGRHNQGTANIAAQQYGATEGQIQGLQGQSYGFLTKEPGRHSSSLQLIDDQVGQLYWQASQRPDLQFVVPPINEGIPGLTERSVIDRFVSRPMPTNVSLPGSILYPDYKGLRGSTYALTEQDLFGDDPIADQWRNRWSQLEGWNEHYLRHILEEGNGVIHQFQYQPIAVTDRDRLPRHDGRMREMDANAVRRGMGR